MKKHISGKHRAAVPPEVLWAALSDPERLGAALPDVRYVRVDGPDRFEAGVRPSTNLGATPLKLEVHIAEREEAERVRIAGTGDGGEFRVAFDVELRMRPDEDSGSEVLWTAEVQAFGAFASLTQRILPWLLRDQVTLVLEVAEDQATASPTPAR